MEIHCTQCLGVELEHINHKGTDIYVCPECPSVTFEFITQNDVQNLADYLNKQK